MTTLTTTQWAKRHLLEHRALVPMLQSYASLKATYRHVAAHVQEMHKNLDNVMKSNGALFVRGSEHQQLAGQPLQHSNSDYVFYKKSFAASIRRQIASKNKLLKKLRYQLEVLFSSFEVVFKAYATFFKSSWMSARSKQFILQSLIQEAASH